jgi:hypothetical protein
MKLELTRQAFEKSSDIKFHENLSSESRLVPRGQTDGQADRLTKLVIAFCNFAEAPKMFQDLRNPVFHYRVHKIAPVAVGQMNLLHPPPTCLKFRWLLYSSLSLGFLSGLFFPLGFWTKIFKILSYASMFNLYTFVPVVFERLFDNNELETCLYFCTEVGRVAHVSQECYGSIFRT